ncbi:MAG: chromate transporter [Planctomycetes bacterium]|nr:chromate transporter [Planctomycetota bacterium]
MYDKYSPLVLSFVKIGLFGFGGGYAILPLISHQVVDIHRWTTYQEFTDIVAISQMTPGPIALNAATYVGFTQFGVLGSALATLSVCFAPFIIMSVVCKFFLSMKDNPRVAGAMRLLRPAVIGLVAAAALLLMNRESFVDWKSGLIFALVFASTVWLRVHPIPLLVSSGVIGWLLYS